MSASLSRRSSAFAASSLFDPGVGLDTGPRRSPTIFGRRICIPTSSIKKACSSFL
ncbi:hypothetical protein PF002_g24934 [Phytophthora fragariae]|uniref:Uncharacterized protein n=1 Tax=Phytophthora fragariae TaxID=53985 RepID=A0A6A3DXA7_9STRA|nr:hypothetical protein PF009_g25195 [Phytophthora fragariae]KAE9175434.1 hypothetical protein PF004_g26382 [Phytophthora fragariae]KAE9189855.1 hypothetical protein PF002_g24934 [Phytophthora fragariae]